MPKQPKNGSDIGKLPEGYAQNREIDFDEEKDDKSPIVSFRECLYKLEQELDNEGYQLIASPTGRFCGYDVYVRASLDVPGLNQPKGFAYFKLIGVTDTLAQMQFLSKVRAICEEHRADASKKEAGVWERLALSFDDQMTDPKSPVARIAQSSIGLRSRVATLTGRSGYHKVVPPLEWFPKAVQDYNPEDLLTLFPKAEKDQLVLILGRVLAGASGTKTAEGLIKHTARSYGLIVGTIGGMGKSTLMNYIKDVIERLGYTTAQINSDLNKFGWGAVATADLATIDDLTKTSQKTMLHHVMVKSIVSNGFVKVEEKGMPAVDVKACSTILGCTNTTNYADYIDMDGGSLSRLNQLDTYTPEELAIEYPGVEDARILPYWTAKAKELKCEPELLAARLLRHCLDRFLDVTGHSFDERGLLTKDLAKDQLEQVTKTNRENFRIDVNLRHAEELPQVISHLVALAIADTTPRNRQKLLDNLQHVVFSPLLLFMAMELFASGSKYVQDFPDLAFRHTSLDSKPYIRQKLPNYRNLGATNSVEKAFQVLIAELKSDKGFGYPSRSSHYQVDWVSAKRLVPNLVLTYEQKIADISQLDGTLDAVIKDVQRFLAQITE